MGTAAATERSPALGFPASGAPGLGLQASPTPPKQDPSFPVPGSPHLNFGGARAAKLSADLQRTPALAAHRAPGEEREVGGEGEGAGLRGGRGRAVARHLPALRVVQAATAAAAARTRGRGGAGSSAPLWAPPPRCAPLQPRRPPCPGPEPESRRLGWPEAGRGGSLQHLPLLPLPAAQIKKQQKATNHPQAERAAAGGGRSVRRPDSAGGAHGWTRAGLGWDAGPASGARFGCSSRWARAPALAAAVASAAASAAASTSPLGLRRLCRRRRRAPARAGALNAARGLPAKPGPDSLLLPPHTHPTPATSAPLPPPSASLPAQHRPLRRRRL